MNKSILSGARLVFALLLVSLMAFTLTSPVQATTISDTGHVAADETINDDLLIADENVIIDGTVNGVVMAFGNRIVVNGKVNGDLMAFGQSVLITEGASVDGNIFSGAASIEVRGKVSGSLFGGSGSLTVGNNAVIDRNLYYGGYSLETMAGSKINTDLMAGAYQTMLAGNVDRDLKVSAAAIELDGSVGRNAELDVASVSDQSTTFFMPYFQPNLPPAISPGLRIGADANISGDLVYTSPEQQSEAIQTQPEGQVIYQTPVPGANEQQTSSGAPRNIFVLPFFTTLFDILRDLVTLLLLGGLALWLLPNLFQRTVDAARQKPLESAGVGLLTFLGGYAGAFIAFVVLIGVGLLLSLVTLGGLSRAVFGAGFSVLALAVTVFTLLVSYGSKLVVAFLVGQLLINQAAPAANNKRLWALLSGVVIYVILRAIPILGWLIGLAAVLVGLGAMWFAFRSYRKQPVAANA